MKKIIAAILTLSLLISGCTHHLEKYSNESQDDYYNRVSELCKNKDELTITTIGGEKYIGKLLNVSADSTKFFDLKSNSVLCKTTKEISTFTFKDYGTGVADGFLSGLWIGGGTGLLLGQLLSGGSSGGIGRFYFLLYSLLGGVIIGTTYGYLNPSTTIVKIH